MKITKVAVKDDNYDKMKEWFYKRTGDHIGSVQAYCHKIAKKFPEFAELIERAEKHDQSKYKDPEVDPYIYTTWKYKCKDDGVDFECPKEMEEKMTEATEHHVKNNRHHPEFHCDKTENLINENDRDKPPEEMIDATKMEDLDIAEMVADWCAVSKERGNSPKSWADSNVNVRWKFTADQKELIYHLIDEVWEN
jgi:hypothetical protein